MALTPIRNDNRLYYPPESHLTVINWCRDKGVTLDQFAACVGLNRANLVNILKGMDAVAPRVAIAINEELENGPTEPPKKLA